jgi:hypothetical protein
MKIDNERIAATFNNLAGITAMDRLDELEAQSIFILPSTENRGEGSAPRTVA